MLFIECETCMGCNTYINVEKIESIWTIHSSEDYHCLQCTTISGEKYTLYTADKKIIDYLRTRLIENMSRRSVMEGIIDLETLL